MAQSGHYGPSAPLPWPAGLPTRSYELSQRIDGWLRERRRRRSDHDQFGGPAHVLGIVVLEIPSNIVLQRLGPREWISAQVLIFGAVATLQVFVRDKTAFLVARSFLGSCEADYIPGGIYTLSTWYTKRELAKRVAVFFFGMFGGNAISPVLASGILQLRGRGNLKGWQWLFLSKSDSCHN